MININYAQYAGNNTSRNKVKKVTSCLLSLLLPPVATKSPARRAGMTSIVSLEP